jgi:serine/threonine protein kinase
MKLPVEYPPSKQNLKSSYRASTIKVRGLRDMPVPGDILGHYRIEEFLGEGAFGAVYRGEDVRLGRKVALKVLHAKGGQEPDPAAWGQLLQEARAASALNHANICATYDIGEDEGINYIALEYVDGQTLSHLLRSGPLSPDLALSYAIQITRGLEHAHAHGIIHRDLKASNVMITLEGQAKLLDFGLARRLDPGVIESMSQSRRSLAEMGNIAGTLSYMAPEVLRGKTAGPSSDLWSLGALVHEMVSAHLPFEGETPFELTMAIMVEAPEPLPATVPESIRALVTKCLQKEPQNRFLTAQELLEQLESARASIARHDGKASPWLTRSAVAVISLIAIIGTAFIWRSHEAKPVPPKIEVLQKAPPPAETAPDISLKPVPPPPNQKHPPASAQAHKTSGNPKVEVWVNLKTSKYHCPGSYWYKKKTANGALMTQGQAQLKGYHPASNEVCE